MITLYTIHCSTCNQLKRKLDTKNISYEECTDMDIMKSKGIKSAPYLGITEMIDGVEKETLLKFNDAWSWCNKQ